MADRVERDGGAPAERGALRGRQFVLLCLATFGGFANYSLLLSVVPLWAAAGGAGDTGVGATTSVLMLTTVLTQLTVPQLLRRMSHRAVLGVGAVLLGAPALAYVASSALPAVLAVSALRGVGFGLLTVAGAALLPRLVPHGQLGRAVGVYGFAVGTPNLVFLPGGVGVAQQVGFTAVFLVGGVLPLVAVIAVAGMGAGPGGRLEARAGRAPVAEPDRHPPEPAPPSPTVLAGPWTVMTGAALATGGMYTFLPLAVERAGQWVAPAALLAFGAANLVGRWGAGVIGDRLGRGRVLVPGVVTAGVGLLGPAAAADPGVFAAAGTVTTGVAAVAGALLYGQIGRAHV